MCRIKVPDHVVIPEGRVSYHTAQAIGGLTPPRAAWDNLWKAPWKPRGKIEENLRCWSARRTVTAAHALESAVSLPRRAGTGSLGGAKHPGVISFREDLSSTHSSHKVRPGVSGERNSKRRRVRVGFWHTGGHRAGPWGGPVAESTPALAEKVRRFPPGRMRARFTLSLIRHLSPGHRMPPFPGSEISGTVSSGRACGIRASGGPVSSLRLRVRSFPVWRGKGHGDCRISGKASPRERREGNSQVSIHHSSPQISSHLSRFPAALAVRRDQLPHRVRVVGPIGQPCWESLWKNGKI